VRASARALPAKICARIDIVDGVSFYDHEGHVTTKVGNGLTMTFSWDHRERLTEVQSSGGPQGNQDDTFTYDVFDRRIGKHKLDGPQLWTAYSGNNPYADFNGSTLTNRYLYGDDVDQLFARLDANPVTITWYLADNVGSVRQLVDNAGTVQDTVTYGDSYGTNPSDSGTGDRFKFTGREYDSETGLYYYRARYYDPAVGRFLSQDPIGFAGGDTNLYRYVRNQPARLSDPLGTDSITDQGIKDAQRRANLNKNIRDRNDACRRIGQLQQQLDALSWDPDVPDTVIFNIERQLDDLHQTLDRLNYDIGYRYRPDR
jgi:RHS repeat-associated protein